LLRCPASPTDLRADRSGIAREGGTPLGCVDHIERSPDPIFVVQYSCVEMHPAARRHGIAVADILHAIDHSLLVDDLGDDPDRWLVIGPDRAANLLELVVLITTEGDELIIHAMPLRPVYRKLLEP
jgi:hypothetical protein